MKELFSGNQAIARGAWEAGVTLAVGYPGTPSTEILENIVQYKNDLYCEWAPNEKVALEVAVGASLGGARCLVTMKHVGMNVAADPLMTLAMIGTVGGMVIVIADDPGMHSSQNEQDSRHWGAFGKVPIIEPSDSQEASSMVKYGLELSEKFCTPVILRTTTRIAHSRSLVELKERKNSKREIGFVAEQARFVAIPLWARKMRITVEQRINKLIAEAELGTINFVDNENNNKELGIITGGVLYHYAKEIFPHAAILKLGMTYPLPEEKIRNFVVGIKKILVIEELDSLIETQIKAWGIRCSGRDLVPGIGEITPDVLRRVQEIINTGKIPSMTETPIEAQNLPARPPVLCPGCPHRGTFTALKKFDVCVMGDIGCYSLASLPPLERMNTILCMGGAIGMAHGLQKAGEKKTVCGVMGDSTFFHSGITSLLNVVYNRGNSTIIVVDNRTTAMTGHQEHPGSGKTLMGDVTASASISAIAQAVGVKRVRTVNPYNLKEMNIALKEEFAADEPSLIIAQAPCPLQTKKAVGAVYKIDAEKCVNCRTCVKIGCPAIEASVKENKPIIKPDLCAGCGLCAQVCPKKAIR